MTLRTLSLSDQRARESQLRCTTSAFALFGCLFLAAQVDSTSIDRQDTLRRNEPQLPVFTITADDLDSELGSQDISGILQSSRDVFTNTAGFTFGQARFRIRGFDSENMLVSINGVLMNDLETGWASWSNWAGLNDITRWNQVRAGVNPSRYNFGGIGGYTEMNVQPSALRKGLRVSYASTNRAYRNRIMATYNTGMQKNGWAFSISGSKRWAEEGYVDGTSFNAYAYFVGAEKKFNEQHSVSLSAFGAPIIQGRQGLAIQEAFDLVGSNYYNPNWGYQDGEKRNARMSFDHKPMIMATHVYTPKAKAKLTSSLFYTFGRDGLTNLNWFDAKDPRPDYYRYLPSYFTEQNPSIATEFTNAWQTDENARQIDWDQLYFANSKNLFSLDNANGSGSTLTGLRSKYIVEEQRADPTRIGINSVYTIELEDGSHFTLGGSFHKQKTHYFKTVEDLLGGEFWVDIDQFADRDFNDPNISQNDLSTPNRVVREGDLFGYDYDIHTRMVNVFSQYERKFEKVDVYAGMDLSQTSFWRDSRFQNGRFPDNSAGESDKENFFHFGVKGGATYKLTGRQFISANAAFVTRPPSSRTAFVSPRTRHTTVPGLTNENAYSGDISYIVRSPRIKGRATLYYARISDQIWSRSFYHDEYLTLVNYVMTGVDQVHQGVELGVEGNITSTWQASAVLGLGDYRYASRPVANITRDNSTEVFASDRTVFWENYKVGGMPQTAASLGLRYNSPKFWFAGVNANYFDDIYLDPNPDRRTVEALGNFVDTDPQWDDLLTQTKLDANMTVDLFAGKSWMVKGYRIAVNGTISNLLNNQDFRIGGFEQLRYDRTDVGRFPPKYSYLFGRNYFVMVTFSF
ncbi:MAG: TonB-dependent receptor plug domain-containing protein [Flavobacteriales bacterium]|nr:TonB-dependent receptor plug domain-containing protein [Flavobacteriales bacterium]